MPVPPPARLVVIGRDGSAVGRAVRRQRSRGVRVAGFVGDDAARARELAEEVLAGPAELVRPDDDAEG